MLSDTLSDDEKNEEPSPNNNHKPPNTNFTSPNNEISRMVSEIASEIKYPEPDGRVQCPRCDLIMSKNSIRRHIKVVHLKQKRSDHIRSDPLLSEAIEQNHEEEDEIEENDIVTSDQLLNCNQCSYKTYHKKKLIFHMNKR